MISQEQLIEKFLPYLQQHGVVYGKFKQVKARPAIVGEMISTFTSDGLETQNKADAGDFIVQNITEANEQYILKEPAFHQKYQLHGKTDGGWSLYDPKGQVFAVELTQVLAETFNWPPEFYFEAPWKESIIVKTGDFLVTSLPEKKEIYRIARKEFFETYKKKE